MPAPAKTEDQKKKKGPEHPGGPAQAQSAPGPVHLSESGLSAATGAAGIASLQGTAGNGAVGRSLKPVVALRNGHASFQELEAYLATARPEDLASLNPASPVIRNLLHGALQQSWTLAKETLAYAGGRPDQAAREALMKALWRFREWHWKTIIQKAQASVAELTGRPGGLKDWPSAGSESLTSDIDVNLKGDETELAVKVFNAEFKKDGWDYESGVVYDVNVYAMDFMHAFKGMDVNGLKQVGKEGKRKDQELGGFREVGFRNFDAISQDVWSLVKLRLYMPEAQWNEYLDKTNVAPRQREEARTRYTAYMKELREQMQEESGGLLERADSVVEQGSGIEQVEQVTRSLVPGGSHAHVQREDLKMSASNRIYERKLATIRELRTRVKAEIAEYEELIGPNSTGGGGLQGPTARTLLNGRIEMDLAKLRTLVSEAALWSNEAYVTDAAVNHAVVGLQGGNPIHQTVRELMTAVTENTADSLKEIRRHSAHFWEAAYKASKYLMRLADAAKNAGLGDVPGVEAMYKVGYELSVGMKSGGTGLQRKRQGTTTGQKVEEAMAEIGITTVEGLTSFVVEVSAGVQEAGKARFTSDERHLLAQPSPKGKQTLNVNA